MKTKTPLTESAARRTMLAIGIAAIALAAVGAWLFKQDRQNLDKERRLQRQQSVLTEKMAEAEMRIETIAAQIPPQQDKIAQTEKVIRQLEELQSTWDRVIGNRAQQRANAERLQTMRTLHATTVANVADLQQQIARARWERDNHEIERTRLGAELRVEESRKAGAGYRVHRAWLAGRSWLCFGLALYLLGPVLLPIAWEQWRRKKQGVVVGGAPQ